MLDSGFELPFYVAMIAKNGDIGLGVWRESLTGDGLKFDVLAQHFPTGMFVIPVNMMIVDKRAEAARILLAAGREPVIVH